MIEMSEIFSSWSKMTVSKIPPRARHLVGGKLGRQDTEGNLIYILAQRRITANEHFPL